MRFGLIVAAIAVLFSALAAVGTVPAQAEPDPARAPASISGTVTVPAGVDAGLVEVWAVAGEVYDLELSTMLKPDGSYELSGLPPASYRLQFTGRSGALDQWYNNAPHGSAAEVVTVTDSQQLTGINATLVKGGTISGTLAAPSWVTLTDTKVYDNGVSGGWPVAADGTYKIVGLRAGSHLLWFSGDGHAMARYYDNAPTAETATAIAVTDGQDVTGVNSTLRKGASISGTVTAPAGVTLTDTRVEVTVPGERGWTGHTTVAADGSYHIIGLAPGEYNVNFSVSGALGQWYSSATSWRTAKAISVAEGQDVTGIDAALVKAASISGTVTVPPGVEAGKVIISAYATGNPSASVGSTYLKADGSYSLNYLPAGSYKIEFATVYFTEFQDPDSGALVQWYKNADSFDDATPIVLGTGEDLTGVNATLVKGASISGSVKDPDAIGEHKTTVSLFASGTPGVALETAVINPSDPPYVFKGLRAGSYVVGFSDEKKRSTRLMRVAPAAAPLRVPPPRPNDLNDAGPDVTPAVTGAREPSGAEPTGAAEPSGAGTAEVIERDSGAVAGSNPDARTGEPPNRPYLPASWYALAPIRVAAAVVHRRLQRSPRAR
ncbi:carboxypeptidase-like regulatory domain-containing protein [Arthrobacter sp. AL12]|uniref:carboxypeptidase-like regulatory domain-containing protein n=1 Tax=Arthrobacter sp. AL12 TaxID=3042241 RepID=UPI00249C7E37|nr:carboxypeptidase-like regulatory domain-containing protein [Arthrobacter sp. AL12]MDI3212900.1 carboxypeptidase-like regulatory domain-containing protein [Arthrobacter sp. AL12]